MTKITLVLISFLSIGLFSCSYTLPDKNTESNTIEVSAQTYKPWAYWWWMGSSVTKTGIKTNLHLYKEAGLGGLHIIPIYGVKDDEENYIDFLSPKWMDMLSYTVDVANEIGLGIDMTMGTGWPFGGTGVNLQNSARRFDIIRVDFAQDSNKIKEIVNNKKDAILLHLIGHTNSDSYIDITGDILKNTNIENYNQYDFGYAFVSKPTFQKVKRAAPGGKGLVLDYFSKNAIQDYMVPFDSAFLKGKKVRSFYNDSYEVYNANFSFRLLDKFEQKYAYKLTDFLPILASEDSSETKARIITDYCELIAESLCNDFTKTWVDRSHKLGMITRNQAHGSPGNILDLYAAADIPETESFGSSNFNIPGLRRDPNYEEERYGKPNPLTMKFASSSAHILGKKLVSSETGTWLGDHFKVSLSQIKPQVDELFTAGINHIFYHGITYNPPKQSFPGRLFYASTNFGTQSHFWNELPALNQYIQNCQRELQTSEPDNDILLYFPIHDIWAKKYTKDWLINLDVHHSKKWLEESRFGEIADELKQNGYSFDYVSDKLLEKVSVSNGLLKASGGNYKVIIVPQCTYMPETTLEQLNSLAQQGANVIFQCSLPKKVTGYSNLQKRTKLFNDLCEQIKLNVNFSTNLKYDLNLLNVRNEDLAMKGLSFIRKKRNNETIYFVSNLNNKFYQGNISLSANTENILLFDPLTGKSGIITSTVKDKRNNIFLSLEPGKSCFLKCTDSKPKEFLHEANTVVNNPVKLDIQWTLYPQGNDKDKPDTIHVSRFKSWTLYGKKWETYSGKVLYKGKFNIDPMYVGKRMLLDLKDVRETAKITINNTELDLLWCIPFKTVIPKDVLEAHNTIQIEVGNLSFNKVIDLDSKGIKWKNFKDINIVDIKYKPFDASDKEPVESGLLSEIKLYPIKEDLIHNITTSFIH